jgi:hypothetical protein
MGPVALLHQLHPRGNKDMDADWVLNHTSTTDNRMPGQLTPTSNAFRKALRMKTL